MERSPPTSPCWSREFSRQPRIPGLEQDRQRSIEQSDTRAVSGFSNVMQQGRCQQFLIPAAVPHQTIIYLQMMRTISPGESLNQVELLGSQQRPQTSVDLGSVSGTQITEPLRNAILDPCGAESTIWFHPWQHENGYVAGRLVWPMMACWRTL